MRMKKVKDRGKLMNLRKAIAAGFAVILASAANGAALQNAEQPDDATKVVPLYSTVAPGSEKWTWHEQVSPTYDWPGGGRLVRNVVQPTLTVFDPPNPARKTGAAVIVSPGGGNVWLSIDREGYDVARALAAKGITAIVLKYRLKETPTDEKKFRAFTKEFMQAMHPGAQRPPRPPMSATDPWIADGLAAVSYVRTHAAELGIDPQRIGMVGFSAGGGVTSGAMRFGQGDSRLDFAGVIYAGAPPDVIWPADLGPAFVAVASDDPVAADWSLGLFNSLRTQHHSVELHVFAKGGHGFGLSQHGLTTDLWFEEFVGWLASEGILQGGAKPAH